MPTHNHDDNKPQDDSLQKREQPDASAGYEPSDVKPKGIVIFMIAMGVFAALSGVFCYEIGRQLFNHMAKEDGPKSKWSSTVDVRPLGNMANNPDLKNKMAATTQQFPTPLLQTDDGNQEIANLHAKEDLLLENYSWVDPAQGRVRIPIERAMELIAQNGLPVAPQEKEEPLMTGDSTPVVVIPLTNGFARTGYEQDEARAKAVVERRKAGPSTPLRSAQDDKH